MSSTKKHSARGAVKSLDLRRRGRPSGRLKPLKERLLHAGVTYVQVARACNRSYRTVQSHVDEIFYSPAVQAAIEQLAPVSGGTAA